jgi:hypothetical protein
LIQRLLAIASILSSIRNNHVEVLDEVLDDHRLVVRSAAELIHNEGLESISNWRYVLEPADPSLNVVEVSELFTEQHNGHDYNG